MLYVNCVVLIIIYFNPIQSLLEMKFITRVNKLTAHFVIFHPQKRYFLYYSKKEEEKITSLQIEHYEVR